MEPLYFISDPDNLNGDKITIPMDGDPCEVCTLTLYNAHVIKHLETGHVLVQVNAEDNVMEDLGAMFGDDGCFSPEYDHAFIGNTENAILTALPDLDGQVEITDEDGSTRMVDKLVLPVPFGS